MSTSTLNLPHIEETHIRTAAAALRSQVSPEDQKAIDRFMDLVGTANSRAPYVGPEDRRAMAQIATLAADEGVLGRISAAAEGALRWAAQSVVLCAVTGTTGAARVLERVVDIGANFRGIVKLADVFPPGVPLVLPLNSNELASLLAPNEAGRVFAALRESTPPKEPLVAFIVDQHMRARTGTVLAERI